MNLKPVSPVPRTISPSLAAILPTVELLFLNKTKSPSSVSLSIKRG
jgi:hypothetical protein